MCVMKKIFFPMLGLMLVLAGCQSASQEGVLPESSVANECVGANCAIVRYASPNGNDLVLETDRHIIEIQAPANVPYTYRVWAGEKSTTADPDLVVHDGQAMVLVEE